MTSLASPVSFQCGTAVRRITLMLLLMVCSSGAFAQWTIQKQTESSGKGPVCIMRTEWRKIFDGYQDTEVQIVVHADAVEVRSKAPLDKGADVIGLRVDTKPLVKIESIPTEKTAIFSAAYTTLIDQFKKGALLQLHLQFWPTWPKTGVHTADFSLIGFSKTHQDFIECS